MPELPEAETVRRQLEPQIVGARIIQTWARLPRITQPSIEEFQSTLQDTRIVGAKRRGKQLYFPLENGSNLLVHLGMTGRLHVEDAIEPFDASALHKHIHGVLVFDNARQLVFTDPRTFGALGVATELPFLQAMGPEPLDDDFDENALARKLKDAEHKNQSRDSRSETGCRSGQHLRGRSLFSGARTSRANRVTDFAEEAARAGFAYASGFGEGHRSTRRNA
jgi:DNA-formamidopyrimidine glycosylase